MALSALALITALHSSNLASPAQLATFQQQSIEAATVVTFRSPEQARAAAIGLHHLLLAGDWKSGQLILQLDETEQKKLLPFATSMAQRPSGNSNNCKRGNSGKLRNRV